MLALKCKNETSWVRKLSNVNETVQHQWQQLALALQYIHVAAYVIAILFPSVFKCDIVLNNPTTIICEYDGKRTHSLSYKTEHADDT